MNIWTSSDPSLETSLETVIRMHVRRSVRTLAEAFAHGEASGRTDLVGYVAVPDEWRGLAFARAMIGERGVRGRPVTSEAIAGCAPSFAVVQALTAIHAPAARALLTLADDDESYPVVVVWRSCRVVKIGRRQLMAASYPPSTRA